MTILYKPFFKGVFTLIIMVVFACIPFSFQNNSTNEVTPNEVMIQVTSLDEAAYYESKFDLNLLSVTPYNIAIYETKTSSSQVALMNAGFQTNSISTISGPPWQNPVDPYLDDQYSLVLTDVIQAWDLTVGVASILIAIIDTGIDINHVEFVNRISLLSYNSVSEEIGLQAVIDDVGHGTMVAGIIAANKNNSAGIAGITQNTQLLVIKANSTLEGSFKDSDIIDGIYYAVENGAQIINLSLGGEYANSLTEAAINYATAQGVLVVVASGNDGTSDRLYPAAFENSISVGAIDKTKILADYSNYGNTIDLVAPGSDIITTTRNNGYASVSGTSFAAPHVTAILALYLSLYPNSTVEEIKDKLFLTTEDLGTIGLDDYYGYGMINAYDLLSSDFHLVSFVTSPGSLMESVWILDGDNLIISTIPFLANNIFIGWYLDSQFSIPWIRSVPVTTNLTLYAKYSAAFHTVTFVTNGTSIDPLIIAHGGSITLPETALSGFHFVGWYTDSLFQVIYDGSPIYEDLTLYAFFQEIIYYEITYMVQNEVYQIIQLEEGFLIPLNTILMEGYTFNGWYLDTSFSNPFMNEFITNNFVVYALLEPIILTITFVTSGDLMNPIYIEYGFIPTLINPTKQGEVFAGWFIDAEFTIPYTQSILTENLTLYARFLQSVVTVDLMIEGSISDHLFFVIDEEMVLPSPSLTGSVFSGWFLDSLLSIPFTESIATENITLYGRFNPINYTVRYFGSDGNSVLYSISGIYGTPILPPVSVLKASTAAFDYVFVSWSEELNTITKSVDIYPTFLRTFIPGCVGLKSGIDTIHKDDIFVDEGIYLLDSSLQLVVINLVNSLVPGSYIITYQILSDDEIVYELKRVVHVLEKQNLVVITLKKGISTVLKGQTYTEARATTNYGVLEIIGSVDTQTPGIYQIIYQVNYNGSIYQKSRFVFVIDANPLPVVLVNLSQMKEDDYYA